MEYKLNELNEPIITHYNKTTTFDAKVVDNKVEWYRLNVDNNVIILSEYEMQGIVDYYNGFIRDRKIYKNK